MIDLSSTGLRRPTRLANKSRQKYGLFDKLSIAVIVSFEEANNPCIFITRAINMYRKVIENLI